MHVHILDSQSRVNHTDFHIHQHLSDCYMNLNNEKKTKKHAMKYHWFLSNKNTKQFV